MANPKTPETDTPVTGVIQDGQLVSEHSELVRRVSEGLLDNAEREGLAGANTEQFKQENFNNSVF